MKLKKITIGVITLIMLLVFVLPLFLSSKYHFERSIEINSPIDTVFTNVKYFKNWKKWSPWYASEPTAQYSYLGVDGQIGSSMSWEGEKVGVGSNTLIEIQERVFLKNLLQFKKPFESKADDIWKFESTSDGRTKVTWVNEMALTYPFGRLMGLGLDKMLKEDFEKGLNSLKKASEK